MDYQALREQYDKLTYVGFILHKHIYEYKQYLLDPNTPIEHKKRTIAETLLELHRFDRFLLVAYPNIKDVKGIKTDYIKSYISFCKDSLENETITINKKIRAIRQLFTFLRDVKHILAHNIALDVDLLSYTEAKHPLHIPKGKLKILIDLLYSAKYGLRDVCITKILAYIGLQLGEIFALKASSINLDEKKLYVKRSTGDVIFAIPDDLCIDLREHGFIRAKLCKEDSDNSLFLSITGKPYPVREYQMKFKNAVIKADFKEPYTPRNVRASFAYYMAKTVKKAKLKKIMNQEKVEHYYIEEVIHNSLLPKQ